MTQTQHTTRSCSSSIGSSSSSSSSSSNLQHAQQRRRRQLQALHSTLLLLLLISCGIASSAAAVTAPSRRSPSQSSSVRSGQQVDYAASLEAAEETGCCQGTTTTTAYEPSTDLGNLTSGYDGSKSLKRNSRSIRLAPPAICSPQPTIVDLNPLAAQLPEHRPYYEYKPSCTRVPRCSGCCGSSVITCQPIDVKLLEMNVQVINPRNIEPNILHPKTLTVTVESHTKCKCGCRIKAENCNVYQEYKVDVCRCECQNTDALTKCSQQRDKKYWDEDKCTCACQVNQSCTTGTVFDDILCKCTDPSVPIDFADRRRFIVKAVAVEPDNSTLYSV